MTRAIYVAIPALIASILLFTGCDSFSDSAPDSASGRIIVRLTDAPLDADAVNVSIEGITLVDTRSGSHESIDLSSAAQRINLLDFQDGSTLVVADHEVHLRSFDQFRLLVGDDAEIVVGGVPHPLQVVSGSSSGIKFMLLEPVVLDGGTFDVTVDFDAEQSIVTLGRPDNPKGYLLRPVIRPLSAFLNQAEVTFSAVPVITSPDHQAGVVGDTISLHIVASDADNDVLAFGAGGLPPGLEINAVTGEITGILTEAGYFDVTVTVADNDGVAEATFGWTVEPAVRGWLESVTVPAVSGSSWTVIPLRHSYESMVAVCSIDYTYGLLPLLVRMRNAVGSQLEVRLQNPTWSSQFSFDDTVHCLIAEEGTWQLPDGRPLEARRYLSTVTDENNSWVGERREYGVAFADPVVVGQVMSYNDTGWSVFWSRGATRSEPPSATDLWAGKHVGEDYRAARNDEEIGYIVLETGTEALDDLLYSAALGPTTVQGVFDGAPFTYSFAVEFPAAPALGIVSMSGMKGTDGAWAVLDGPDPLSSTQIRLVVHEDQIRDGERYHAAEQVAYVVFERTIDVPLTAISSDPIP